MSYDIYLNGIPCDKCGHVPEGPELPGPTYNLSQIFDLALTNESWPNPEIGEFGAVLLREKTDRPRGLRVLSGKKASDTEAMLALAVERMTDESKGDAFKALEPENGWGDLSGAIKVMRTLLSAAREYPDHTWEIH
jgi:hypothetical protein